MRIGFFLARAGDDFFGTYAKAVLGRFGER
jgi:hypothetical protein